MKPVIIIAIAVIFTVGIGLSINVSAEEKLVPSWIKNTVEWWAEGTLNDREFLRAIEYLATNNIIQINENDLTVGEKQEYQTYFNAEDGYKIDIHYLWTPSEYSFEQNSILIYGNDQESIQITKLNNNDSQDFLLYDYVYFELIPMLEETSTDFEPIDEKWLKYDGQRWFYGYQLEYTDRSGNQSYENTMRVEFSSSDEIFIILYAGSSNPSINIEYVLNSFQIGNENDYGTGYTFDSLSESSKTKELTSEQASNMINQMLER